MGCGCGKKTSGPVNMMAVGGSGRSLRSDLKKSRQLPPSTLRQLSVQRELNANTKRAEQEKVRVLRQRMAREKLH